MVLKSIRKATQEELIQRIEELQKENYEIRQWKYVIDNPIDLDKLKELDLIKIKGKEYISKDKILKKLEDYETFYILNPEAYRKGHCRVAEVVLRELLED